MKSISAPALAAYTAGSITAARKVTIELVGNTSIGSTITPSASSTKDATVTPASKAVNGILYADRKWAISDPIGSHGKTDGTYYTIPNTGETGWWGGTASDSAGVCAAQTLTLAYSSATLIRNIQWWGDSYQGYPVNFVVNVNYGAGFVLLTTVTGWASNSWSYDFGALTSVTAVQISITKTSSPYMYPNVIEFQGGLTLDVSSAVKSIAINTERQTENATLEIGTGSAASLSLALDNTAVNWSPHNSSNVYKSYLRSNRRILVQEGITYGSTPTTEYLNFGTYFSMKWSAVPGEPIANISAQDRMKRLRETKYATCPLYVNTTCDQIIAGALVAAGFGGYEYNVNTSSITIPYAFCDVNTSYMQFILNVAAAAGGFCYFDGNGRFNFEDASFLSTFRTSSVFTFTDTNSVISYLDEWDEADVRNRVTVNINALKLASSTVVWNLQEQIAIAGSSSVTINVVFQNPTTAATATPIITSSGGTISVLSWTPYAYGGVMVVQNTSGSAGTLLTATVSGQALTADGSQYVNADDTATIGTDGARVLSLNNPFIQNRASATTIANNLLTQYKNPPAKLKITALGLPFLDLGDRVTVISTLAGISADYWIIRHSFTDDGTLISTLDLLAAT